MSLLPFNIKLIVLSIFHLEDDKDSGIHIHGGHGFGIYH
jgi:hypothetical protein